MATTTRGTGRGTTKTTKAAPARRGPAKGTRARKPAASLVSATTSSADDIAQGLLKAVRARPYAAAAIAAGAAGASAFLWAKRALIGDQAAAAGEKLGELRDQTEEQVSAVRLKARSAGKKAKAKLFKDEASDGAAPNGDVEMLSTPAPRGKKSQRQISEEALSLKQTGDQYDKMLGDEIKVGAIAY